MYLPDENQEVNSGSKEKHPGNEIETVTSENENMHPVPGSNEEKDEEDNQG